jgi:long-chain acyl-CoA synthetase
MLDAILLRQSPVKLKPKSAFRSADNEHAEEFAILSAEVRNQIVGIRQAHDVSRKSLTFPQRMLWRLCDEPNHVAFRQKHHGIYRDWTWADFALEVARLANGLRALGFARGERIALLSDPRVETLTLETAALSMGALSANLYLSHPVGELEKLLIEIEPSVVVVDRQDQLVKVLAGLPHLASIKAIILLDGKIKFMYPQQNVVDFALLHEGRLSQATIERFLEDIASGQEDDPALIFFTHLSATPQAIVHSHKSFGASLQSLTVLCPALMTSTRSIAVVPTAHVIGRLTIFLPFIARTVVHYPEQLDNLREALMEVAPNFLFLPPRIFQRLAASISGDLGLVGGLKRIAYRIARASAKWAQVPGAGLAARLAFVFARLLVFQPLLDKVGLARVRHAFTGGGSISADVLATWRRWGVEIRQVYLSAEFGVLLAEHARNRSSEFVGTTIGADCEVSTNDDGALLVRGATLSCGFWRGTALQRRAGDGWCRTGDLARIKQDRVFLAGREGGLARLSDGIQVSPRAVSTALKKSDFISEAIVIGDGRSALVALIAVDVDYAGQWARRENISYTSNANLIQEPQLQKKIASEISLVSAQLSDHEKIRGFRIIPVDLDPELGVVSPSRTVNSSKAKILFADLIAEIYEEQMKSEITQSLPNSPRRDQHA